MKKDSLTNKKTDSKTLKEINSVKKGPNAIKKTRKEKKIDN